MPTLIRSVQKAVRIVELIATAEGGLSASQVADRLELPLATTHHLLGTLVEEGVLSREGRDYHLGPLALLLGDATASAATPPPHLRQPLRKLAEATGETAYVSVWRNGGAVVLATVEGVHAVRVSSLRAGFGRYAHARAAGKVLLAFGRPERLDAYLAEESLEGPTDRAIHDRTELRAELDRVRLAGVGFDREEFSEGAMGIAAPVLDGGIAVAAYAVTAPSGRFHTAEASYAEAVLAAAAEAARAG